MRNAELFLFREFILNTIEDGFPVPRRKAFMKYTNKPVFKVKPLKTGLYFYY